MGVEDVHEDEGIPEYRSKWKEDPQPPPTRVVFGKVVWCPRCKGNGKVKIAGKVRPCERCVGTGVITNEGPVPPIKKP